jgi:uncharacterized Zn-finger protein
MTSSHHTVPHIHNTSGVAVIRVGVKRFMCIGALPPFDHPHVFLNIKDEKSVVCPYCSTYFLFDSQLKTDDISRDYLWNPHEKTSL